MLSVSVNSVPLWLIIVAEKLTLAVYGNRTTESRERTEDERTETTIATKQLCNPFKCCNKMNFASLRTLRLIIAAKTN
jgi:hypothetical protein